MDAQGEFVLPASGRVRYRPSRTQQLPFLLIVVAVALQVVIYTQIKQREFLLLPAVLLVEFSYLSFMVGITLTADGAVVHNLRRRRIRWADVESIRIERYCGMRTIVIYEVRGRHTRLRAPIGGFLSGGDRRFNEKFDTIGQCWVAYRGAEWNERTHATGWNAWNERTPAIGWNEWNTGLRSAWLPRAGSADGPRMRPAFSQGGPIFLALACVSVEVIIGGIMATGPGAGPSVVGRIVAGCVLAVLAAAAWQFTLRAGVSLGPDAVQVHNMRRRSISWSDVSSITVERTWTGSRLVIHETGGTRTRLSGPRIGLLLEDRGFTEKAYAIHRWWVTYRGAVPTGDRALGAAAEQVDEPAAEPPALDLSAIRPPRLWKQIVVGVLCAAMIYELLVGFLVIALFGAFGALG